MTGRKLAIMALKFAIDQIEIKSLDIFNSSEMKNRYSVDINEVINFLFENTNEFADEIKIKEYIKQNFGIEQQNIHIQEIIQAITDLYSRKPIYGNNNLIPSTRNIENREINDI